MAALQLPSRHGQSSNETSNSTDPRAPSISKDDAVEKHINVSGADYIHKPSPWRWRLMLLLIYLTTMLNGYDVSNVANIQAPVYEEFGHIQLLPWVALSYTMGAVAIAPLLRQMVESFNTRILSVVFYLIFMASCAVSGSASTLQALIIGRVIMGLGYTGIYQLNLVSVSIFADSREATRIAGAVGLCWAAGVIVGPFVGAGFAENSSATWRWAFYVNLPFLGVLLCVAGIILPSYTIKPSHSLRKSLSEIDVVGSVLHCAVAILLPLALTMSGSTWRWSSGSTIATWTILAILFVTYILQQKMAVFTTQKNRIFPVNALTHRTAGLAALGAGCSGFAYAVSLYYLPLFYAFARGASPIQAAIRIMPFIGFFIGSIILSSIALPFIGYYAVYFLLAGIFTLIGAVLMTTITSATPDQTILGYQALLATGTGLVFSNAYSVANGSLEDPRERISAAALFNMASFSGICLALSVTGCVYHNLGFNLLQQELAEFGFDSHQIREALAGVASPVFRSDQRVSGPLAETVTFVISKLFYDVVFAGAVCIISGLAMKWEKMDFKKATDQKVENEGLQM